MQKGAPPAAIERHDDRPFGEERGDIKNTSLRVRQEDGGRLIPELPGMPRYAGLGQVGDMAFHHGPPFSRHALHPARAVFLELFGQCS